MDGDLSFGYNDSFGNQAPSTGNLNFGGTANVKGCYYDPKFLSFNASPYYNQSRLNSNYNSVFDSSGITASAQFFSGSHTLVLSVTAEATIAKVNSACLTLEPTARAARGRALASAGACLSRRFRRSISDTTSAMAALAFWGRT
jgi:hypothetical protein